MWYLVNTMAVGKAGHGASTKQAWRPWRSRVLWGCVIGLTLLRVGVVWAFRTRNPAVIDRIKRFNRRWLNPWMLHRAGGPRWYAGRLEHRGRRTGRPYATPLWVEPVDAGFAIPLPYGRDVDWARNLLAAGEAMLQDHGVRYRVGHPRIVPVAELLPLLPLLTRRIVATYGIREFMRVEVLPNGDSAPQAGEP
jgi:deazaflavin-dependent oxidoreductase (nitroreductase family)